jgi:hypothetical protein
MLLRACYGDINPHADRVKNSAEGLERLRRHLDACGIGIDRRGAVIQRVGYEDLGVLIVRAILDPARRVIQQSPG